MLDIASLGYEISFQELQTKWHHAEVEFREEERFRREIDDARRAANEMAEQLKVYNNFCGVVSLFVLFK